MKKTIFFFLGLFILVSFSLRAEEEKNSIIVCDNGLEMLQWDLEFIKHAEKSIELSPYFFGGKIAQDLLSAIEARLEVVPDLQVFILTTPILIGAEDKAVINRLLQKFPHNFHIVQASNVTIIWPDVSGIDNHTKMCLIDEKYFSAGGTNLYDAGCSEGTYTPPRSKNDIAAIADNLPAAMRDQDIVGRGPMAKELRVVFHKLYALWEHYVHTGHLVVDPEQFKANHYFDVTAKPLVEKFETFESLRDIEPNHIKLVLGGPHQKKNAITQEYTRLINEAKEEIVIANLYFYPADSIFEALLNAVNRGVKLTVITNGESDLAPTFTKYFGWANRMSYVPMFYGSTYHFWDAWSVANKKVKNTRIYEYYLNDVLLHKKMMIVDHKTFLVGSYNLGLKSDIGDYETVIVINSKEVAQDIHKVHERDKKCCREITPKQAREWYFNPATSYLGELQRRFHGLL